MAKEIELKIFRISKKEVLSRLKKLHAKYITTHNFKRLVFVKNKSSTNGQTLRLRTDGQKNTLTFKNLTGGRGLDRVDEYETEVKDFDATAKIIGKLFKNVLYFENRRIEYRLKGVTISIDKWPFIPWHVEIEGKRQKSVLDAYKRLKIKGKNMGNVSAGEAYKIYGLDYMKIGTGNSKKLHILKN